jgi:hypothetical protein
MQKTISLIIGCILIVFSASSVTAALQDSSTPCTAWDITGTWQYKASAGGYGTLLFSQNAAGILSGEWHNVAGHSNGNLTGSIVGALVTWKDTYSGIEFKAAVNSGKMAGTYAGGGSTAGTWEATGNAKCTATQPQPSPGTANVAIQWGDWLFRFNLLTGQQGIQSLGQTNGPPIITFPGDVIQTVTVTFFGIGLPAILQVGLHVNNGPRTPLAILTRVSQFTGGAVYQGRVTVPRTQFSGTRNAVNVEVLVDPFNPTIEYIIKTVQNPLIDPSGYIYEQLDNNKRVQDAMVFLYQKNGSTWELWNAALHGQINPQVSDDKGRYGWDVPTGVYQVRVNRYCYTDAQSPEVPIPPPRTDVNIGMSLVGCAALRITDVQLANSSGIPQTEFVAGAEVQAHLSIANSSEADANVQVSWSVTDPQGEVIQDLSGSRTYTVIKEGAEVNLGGTIPHNAISGTYFFRASLTSSGQTSFIGSTFQVIAAGAHAVYLPLILKNPVAKTGFNGKVTYKGVPTAGLTINLRYFDGSQWTTAKTALTDANGTYAINGVADLSGGQKYYVRFANQNDPNYLSYWVCPTVTSYTAATTVPDCSFDVANIQLDTPAPDATVKLPVNFTWNKRGISGENFAWELFDINTSTTLASSQVGDNNSYTLTSQPPGTAYGQKYGWEVKIYQGADSYGMSYYYQGVTFSAAAAQVNQDTLGQPGDPEDHWAHLP